MPMEVTHQINDTKCLQEIKSGLKVKDVTVQFIIYSPNGTNVYGASGADSAGRCRWLKL